MKIVIIRPYATIIFRGGIQEQARMWRLGLENLGHEVIFYDSWSNIEWNKVDVVLFMWTGKLLYDYVQLLKRYKNIKLAIAPIIDYTGNMTQFIIRSRYFGSTKLKFYKPYHDFYALRNDFSCFLVRSEHEKKFITIGFNVDESKVHIVPLSYRIEVPELDFSSKENYCLHVSRLSDPGKNVERLVYAAKKYNFKLKLAGGLSDENEQKWLHQLIDGYSNIEYVGHPNDTILFELYTKAKVFALPSIVEGVGMVAMEASVFGCEIVLTNLGAPKEYYNGRALLVNPLNIDEIGNSILKALKGYSQPELRDYITRQYSQERCSKMLENVLMG